MIEKIPYEIMVRLEYAHHELGSIIKALHAVAEPQAKKCDEPPKIMTSDDGWRAVTRGALSRLGLSMSDVDAVS